LLYCFYQCTGAAEKIASCLVSQRCRRQSAADGSGHCIRRHYVEWDRERAQRCIAQDYLCTIPAFSLDDVKRIFWVSRSSCESIRSYLSDMVPFFHDGVDVTHRRRVSTDAKILVSLKYLAYGCSINAFWDFSIR
jgi:hypothetical protein